MFIFDKIKTGEWYLKFNDFVSFRIIKSVRYSSYKDIPIYKLELYIGDKKDNSDILSKVKSLYNKRFKISHDVCSIHHTQVPKFFSSMVADNIVHILQLTSGDTVETEIYDKLTSYFKMYLPSSTYDDKVISNIIRTRKSEAISVLCNVSYHSRQITEIGSKYEYDMANWNNLPDGRKHETVSVYDGVEEHTRRIFSHSTSGYWSSSIGAFQSSDDRDDGFYSSGRDVYTYETINVPVYKDIPNASHIKKPETPNVSYHKDMISQALKSLIK